MPELPEVEAARVLVHNHCKGKKIAKAIAADDTKVIEGIAPAELQKALQGRTLLEACRKGKQMWLELDGGSPALLLHFGMTGYMAVQGVPPMQYVNAKTRGDEWPPKYWKLLLEMEGGVCLAYCDARRFGKIRMQDDPENNEPISKLGFDPILSMPDLEAFTALLEGQRRAIKALILDQSFSAGVGNWVADEVLYQARIHPSQKASTLNAEQTAALHEQMHGVLRTAVDAGAMSDKFPDTWLFHQKWGAGKKGPAPRLGGNPIKYITVGGRTTAYVPALQKMRGADGAEVAEAEDDEEDDDVSDDIKPPKGRKKAAKAQPEAAGEGASKKPASKKPKPAVAAPAAAPKRAAPKRAAAASAAARQLAAEEDEDADDEPAADAAEEEVEKAPKPKKARKGNKAKQEKAVAKPRASRKK